MEKENDPASDTIDDSESAVESEVLLVFSQCSKNKARKDERENDEKCSLTYGCSCSVNFTPVLESRIIIRSSRCFNQSECSHHHADNRNVLTVHQTLVHLEPAVVLPTVVF